MRCHAFPPPAQEAIATALLHAVFSAHPTITHLALATTAPLVEAAPALSAAFVSSAGAHVATCARASVLPPLRVRHARLADADVLTLVWQEAAGTVPALAQLPAACRPHEPYALERLISSQDEANRVLVAEVAGEVVSGWQGHGLIYDCLLHHRIAPHWQGMRDPSSRQLAGRHQVAHHSQ